jgi:hypothetical protein
MFKNSSRAWTLVLLAIILLAFALRMVRVGSLLMWGDEGFSIFSANRDLIAISFESKDVDPHPPLYYYLLHFYLPIAGFSELAVRFFSVFFGTATIPLLFVIARKMFDARVARLASAIAAFAPFGVQYSQEVRMYALVIFLGALALYLFLQLVETTRPTDSRHSSLATRGLWLGFFLAMLLTQYSLYQAAFLFVAQGIFLLPFLKRRFAFAMRWLAVSCSIVILFLPWLFTHSGSAFTDIKDVAGDTVPMNLPMFLARGFAAISVGPTIPLANAFTLAALLLAVIVIALLIALAARAATRHDWMLVVFVAVPMLSLYPIYFLAPLYRGRLFALAFVPLMLLLARSIALITARARLAIVPIALLIVGASAYSLNNYYFTYSRYSAAVEDYLPAIRMIEQRAQPGDAVLFHAYWQQGYFLAYYRGAPLQYGLLDKQNDLDAAINSTRNVWAIVQALPHHAAEDWLAQNAFPIGEQKFGLMRVISYRAGDPGRGASFATPALFNNGIALLGYRLNNAPLESGRGVATVQLDWNAIRDIASDFTVSVRLTDPRGETIWTQEDRQPASGTRPTSEWRANHIVLDRHALAIPAGTPPGEYAIQVVMYDAKSGVAANIVAPENLRGQALALDKIDVIKPRRAVQLNGPTNALDAQWNEIALVGWATGANELAPGDALPLTLYWQAREKPARDYLATIQILDSASTVRASATYRPANAAFPTRAWDAGEIWLDKIQLLVDAEAVNGDAVVLVSITDEVSNETVAPRTNAPTRGKQIVLTRVKINARTHRFDLPSPKHPLQARFDDQIKLLGYDLDATTFRAGDAIPLTLYWQSLDRIRERYTVFIHVLDASGNIVAQRDGEPAAASAPTTSWLRGEVIADAHTLALPDALAPGDYTLVAGMYQAASGKRLTHVDTNADHLLLTKIRVQAK